MFLPPQLSTQKQTGKDIQHKFSNERVRALTTHSGHDSEAKGGK